MAHKKNTTDLTELLLQCVTQPDPMLSMLEWLCTHLMEAEVDQQLGAEKSQLTDGRSGYRSEAMLIQVVQEAFVQGVSTRKMEKLAHSLGIENLSRSQELLWSAVSKSEGPWSVHAQGLSFPMFTPGWFRQSVSPFPAPHGSAARCISCGIFWPMCRRKRRKPLPRY